MNKAKRSLVVAVCLVGTFALADKLIRVKSATATPKSMHYYFNADGTMRAEICAFALQEVNDSGVETETSASCNGVNLPAAHALTIQQRNVAFDAGINFWKANEGL